MREIKFRAWNIKNKGMIRPENVILLPKREGGGQTMAGNGHNYKLMQFTGLKDSKGIEIYEGDIIKREVIGQPDSVGYGPWNNKIIKVEVKFEKGSFNITGYDVYKHTFEVIGNIWENSELLR